MAGTYVEKIVYGMDKIHVAKLNEETGEYEAPIAILGAKSVECTFEVK